MPFSTLAVNFDAYRELPSWRHAGVLMALARYADRDGRCWPNMRQIARDARTSKSSVQRYLADLSQLGVFSRSRRPGGRYRYEINPPYRPAVARSGRPYGRAVPHEGKAVPHAWRQKVVDSKHQEISDDSGKWEARSSPRGYNNQEAHSKQANHREQQSQPYPNHGDSSRWEARLRGWQKRRMWPSFAGPTPDEPGCWAPPDMIAAAISGVLTANAGAATAN